MPHTPLLGAAAVVLLTACGGSSPVAGPGDEAVLFEGPGGLRYLVARKVEAGIVLFPLGGGFEMTDDQLRELASRALAAAA